MSHTPSTNEADLRRDIEQIDRLISQCVRSERASAKSAVSYLRQVLRDRREALALARHARGY